MKAAALYRNAIRKFQRDDLYRARWLGGEAHIGGSSDLAWKRARLGRQLLAPPLTLAIAFTLGTLVGGSLAALLCKKR